MGQCRRSRQPKWNEVSGRSASLRVPSASTPNCGRKHWGPREGRRGRLLPPRPWAAVFTSRPQEALCVYAAWLQGSSLLSVNNSPFQAATHESRWLTANQCYGRKRIKLTHSGSGVPAATCLFCCNWTPTRPRCRLCRESDCVVFCLFFFPADKTKWEKQTEWRRLSFCRE